MNIKRSARKALAANDMKQKDLAKKLGFTEEKISRWVNSEHLNTANIELMAKAFGMTLSEFIALGE